MLETGHTVGLDQNIHLPLQSEQTAIDAEKLLIHQLIEVQALRTPEAFALISPHTCEHLTYCELNEQANQLAHFLRRKGVRPEVPVCICMDRSPELIVAQLAVMKAGGAYVPLDPSYPASRLVGIVQEVQPSVLVLQEQFSPLFTSLQAEDSELLCFDTEQHRLATEPTANIENLAEGENLAYIIYTSGSTGQPKGVQISHHNLKNLVLWKQHILSQGPEDRESCLAGVAFDAAQWEIWPTLISGGRLYLPEAQVRLSAELLQAWILEHRITICSAPTQLAEGLLKLCWPEDCALRYLPTGGDRLHIFAPEDLPFTLINGYGPTENTIVSTCCVVPLASADSSLQMPTIGTAIANVETYILDDKYKPVPVGQEGELYLGGKGLSRGYFHRPDWTAERFIPHPFAQRPGACLYHTGDVCRYTPDGQIEFIGRSDQQLKIRGFRIELGDIEAALSQHPMVAEAVVTIYRQSAEHATLVAYLVPHKAQELVPSDLRAFLLRLLPEYMVPTHFLTLDALPLTPNGKVDRQALPEPVFSERARQEDFLAPRTETERVLIEICQSVLHFEHISVQDNLFLLGASSLLATLIMSRVRSTFQVVLPLVAIFQAPTVLQLAELIEQARQTSEPAQAPMITAVGREKPIPLSFSQERVWFMHYLDPSNTSYHFQATLRFKGQLQVSAIEMALNDIVRRHEIFRTTVLEIDGQPVQNIHNFVPFALPLLDIRDLPRDQREERFQALVRQESQRLFDLTCLPLVRWILVRLDEQDYGLIHVEHHLVHDGWSFNVFLHEFLALYRAFAVGEPSCLPEPTIQFADFVAWHRQWMQEGVQEQQLTYWKQKLQGAPTFLPLPADYPRPAVQRFKGSAVRLDLPGQLYSELSEVGKREGVTLFTVMLAAFCLLMAQSSGQDDFCLGSAIANRRWKETEGLLGMLVNNIILRIQLDKTVTLRDLLRQLHTLTMEAYENQDLPFDKIVEALHVKRDLSHNPLFQVMFSLHDSAAPQLELPDLDVAMFEGINNGSAKFDMNITIAPRFIQKNSVKHPTAITLQWEYNTDLFARSTVERMVTSYQFLLQKFVEDCNAPLQVVVDSQQFWGATPLAGAQEDKEALLEALSAWNKTGTAYPRQRCVHELFEEQVALTPGACALTLDGRSMTYQELNARANQVAHMLLKRGVKAETLVGICMERSFEMIVGLLGILKAGGAYVPLDASYPQERLAFMLEDTAVSLVLTQPHLTLPVLADKVTLFALDCKAQTLAGERQDNPCIEISPAHLAYVMYTSGSTGTPKGVAVTHANIVRLVKETNYAHFGADEVFFQFAPIAFDASTLEIWGPLLNGARLVICPADLSSLQALGTILQQNEVTTLWLTAGLFHQMVEDHLEGLASVRQLLAGGDVLSLPHVRKVLAQHKECTVINGYGPTECTTFACCYPMRNDAHLEHSVPIGRPIANAQVYLLDEAMQPVSIGTPGELYIGGDGLARGYLNRSDLTAERFVPHPYSAEAGARLYKTGDLARFLQDGRLEFIGRGDNQVKIRGFRIELGEIEATLLRHPAVSACVVNVQGEKSDEKILVAYVVTALAQHQATAYLSAYLRETLPAYMLPAAFVMLDALPLTNNGKIDRSALPAFTPQRLETETQFVEPSGAIACTLAEMWRQVLRIDQVGIHDNFFQLGGQSLLATRVLSRIRQTFQVEVSLRFFFDAPTIASLASAITQSLASQQRMDAWMPETTPVEISDLSYQNYQELLGELEHFSDEEVDQLLDSLSNESLVSQ